MISDGTMTNLSIGELAEIVGGRLRLGSMPPLGGEIEPVGRLAVDSGALRPGEVFWALPQPGQDAACSAQEALARGAAGVVVAGRRVEPWAGTFSIEVDDAKWALWQLARATRGKLRGNVVAIAGGIGKTTTAHMIDTVLGDRYCGTSFADNERHADFQHVGLAIELSALDEEQDYALCELHGRCEGELVAQTQLCRPQIAVVTPSCRRGESAGGIDAIAELLSKLPTEGLAVLNGDDPGHRRLAAATEANIMRVGRGAQCDIVASDVRASGGELSFLVDGVRLRLPVWGRHHLFAALAACAVARNMGLPWERVAQSLAHVRVPTGRCQVVRRAEAIVIDDTYCTTPMALRASFEALRDVDTPGRRVVVLGELADSNRPAARQVGAAVVEVCGADRLVACGRNAGDVVAGARAAGMPASSAQACQDVADGQRAVLSTIRSGDAVLAAGGPLKDMRRVVEAFDDWRRRESDAATNQYTTNIFEVPPLAPVLRETSAALPPGLEQ